MSSKENSSAQQRKNAAAGVQKGEHVIHRASLHWVLYTVPGLIMLGGITLLVLAISIENPDFNWFLRVVSYLIFGFGAVRGLIEYIKIRSTVLIITNKRIYIKEGVITYNSMTISLKHIETVEVSQSLIGRLLNFGKINITASGGAGTEKPIEYVANPTGFRECIQEGLKKEQ
ncbi:PH domain-containing protein [Eisenibacter elegans]|jgi:uncharacterized membrane protein YdbT with pleckstrin-like domain|uniref:PH domain-containing protein n=1 Tax=Eisenibacter elegans TaxID=997 RepID=UPI000413AD17|nr:PH domain-containing protein [Eisenibacter elegans]